MATQQEQAPAFLSGLTRKVELAYLNAFYGALLTGKQREVLALYCEEDMSFGEIAREAGISRQGVYNTLSHAADKLTYYEATLGMAGRFRRMQDAMNECMAALERGDTEAAARILRTVMQSDLQDQEVESGL